MTTKQDKRKTVAMLRWTAALLVIFIALLGCSFFSNTPGAVQPPTSAPIVAECQKVTEPSAQDIAYATNLMGDIFKAGEWEKSYTTGNMRVSVTWINNSAGAVAHGEYLVYPCGYTQKDMDEYFSDENFKVFLTNYKNPKQLAACADDAKKIKLREYRAEDYNKGYLLRFWLTPVNNTHVEKVMVAFPEESAALLDQYAQKMFPGISSCSK